MSEAPQTTMSTQGHYVAARVEPMTFRTKGVDSNNGPARPTLFIAFESDISSHGFEFHDRFHFESLKTAAP